MSAEMYTDNFKKNLKSSAKKFRLGNILPSSMTMIPKHTVKETQK